MINNRIYSSLRSLVFNWIIVHRQLRTCVTVSSVMLGYCFDSTAIFLLLPVICDELFHKLIHRRERIAWVQLFQLHVQVQGIHGARYSPPWQTARWRNCNHENWFSFIMGFKMNIFQKLKHQSYFNFQELSNAFYRFQKFEIYQELW